MELYLPPSPNDFLERLFQLSKVASLQDRMTGLAALANFDLSPVQTKKLAKVALDTAKLLSQLELESFGFQSSPVLVLAEWTADHLIDSLVLAGLRRRILFTLTLGPYGLLHQALLSEELKRGSPRFILFLLDIERRASLVPIVDSNASAQWARRTQEEIEQLAALVRDNWKAVPIFHNFFSMDGTIFGNHEVVIDRGPAAGIARLNSALLLSSRDANFLLWDLNALVAKYGRKNIHDLRLWRNAKLLISPDAAPLAMDQLAALCGAILGMSKKVLVLDLDNTLWGGVIGDDGLNGLRLGPGSGDGESYSAFQRYVKSLSERGVILAIASKNTHEVCVTAIREHPEMLLSMEDFACFRANWNNKADNLIEIAAFLNLGLDSLVFFDDSPAERDLIRQALPMVAVPEIPRDPTYYIDCLEGGRYFESVSLSSEDEHRNLQYRENANRSAFMSESRDLSDFLRSLEMTISMRPYHPTDLVRITQLINKTNQFNLTTRRYSEADVRALGENPDNLVLSARVKDRFGDNGLVSVVIACPDLDNKSFVIDTWLMSCRVFSRQIEQSVLRSLVHRARSHGALYLVGCYVPTTKNHLAASFYPDQGFAAIAPIGETLPGAKWWRLTLDAYDEPSLLATIEEF